MEEIMLQDSRKKCEKLSWKDEKLEERLLYERIYSIVQNNSQHPLCRIIRLVSIDSIKQDAEEMWRDTLKKYEKERNSMLEEHIQEEINRSAEKFSESASQRSLTEKAYKPQGVGSEDCSGMKGETKCETAGIIILSSPKYSKYTESPMLGAGAYLSLLKYAKHLVKSAESPECLERIILVEYEIQNEPQSAKLLQSSEYAGENASATAKRFLEVHYSEKAKRIVDEIRREYANRIEKARALTQLMRSSTSEEEILTAIEEALKTRMPNSRIRAAALEEQLITELNTFWNETLSALNKKTSEISSEAHASLKESEQNPKNFTAAYSRLKSCSNSLEKILNAYQKILSQSTSSYSLTSRIKRELEAAEEAYSEVTEKIVICKEKEKALLRLKELKSHAESGKFFRMGRLVLRGLNLEDAALIDELFSTYSNFQKDYASAPSGWKECFEEQGYFKIKQKYERAFAEILRGVEGRISEVALIISKRVTILKERSVDVQKAEEIAKELQNLTEELRLLKELRNTLRTQIQPEK
ncbi:MAG: hypothetical protein QXW07_04605 [Candidatus Woesearchaeota archaeon]